MINYEASILGVDLDNTLTFRIQRLPWWCAGIIAPFLMILPPNKTVLNMVRRFKDCGGKVVIVSSRPKFLLKLSRLWFKRNNVPYNKIRCVGFMNRSQQKLQVIREEKVTCFIDDDLAIRNFLREKRLPINILSPEFEFVYT